MKASQVKAVEVSLPQGECCVCHKKLIAPWGRNGPDGLQWVCGSTCQSTYDKGKERRHAIQDG